MVTILLARARNGVIGLNNRMPWNIPEELQHFKRTTMGHAVIMGRKTFESIGRPLPGRRMIVVTRQSNWRAHGCETASSLQQAISMAGENQEVFIVGGAEIHRQALPFATRAIITDIDLEPQGDAWIDELSPVQWQLLSREHHRSATGIAFDIVVYRRIAPDPKG